MDVRLHCNPSGLRNGDIRDILVFIKVECPLSRASRSQPSTAPHTSVVNSLKTISTSEGDGMGAHFLGPYLAQKSTTSTFSSLGFSSATNS